MPRPRPRLLASLGGVARGLQQLRDLAAVPRPRLPLALDEGDVGLQAGFQHAASFNESMVVPGSSIGAAGFGAATDQKHHAYSGVAWFARNVPLPAGWAEDDGSTLTFSCGGVKNSATVWLDGEWVGNHSGYMDGFELDLSPALRAAVPASRI